MNVKFCGHKCVFSDGQFVHIRDDCLIACDHITSAAPNTTPLVQSGHSAAASHTSAVEPQNGICSYLFAHYSGTL